MAVTTHPFPTPGTPPAAAHGTLVTGDSIADEHIYAGGRLQYADSAPGVRVHVEAGGAAKLADLLSTLFTDSGSGIDTAFLPVWSDKTPPESGRLAPQSHTAYALWRPKPSGRDKDKLVWRCTEAMGYGSREPGQPLKPLPWPKTRNPPASSPAMIVVSDGGVGFRDEESEWSNLPWRTAQHIVLKAAGAPQPAHKLWQWLTHPDHAGRLTVVYTAADLRKSAARIPAGLTWESTFRGLLAELQPGGHLTALTHCRNLIVAFDSEAAVHLRLQAPGDLTGAQVTFAFRGGRIEEDARNETEGIAFGFHTCFTAAIIHGLAQSASDFAPGALALALTAGLAASQNLLNDGHGPASDPPAGFPTRRIARVILDPPQDFTCVTRPWADLCGTWDFLRIAEPTATVTAAPAHQLARLTARYGPAALRNLPHFELGNLFSIDGSEIETLRHLRMVLRRYKAQSDPGSRPLSVGVFGPPGAGKSFAVKEFSRHLLAGDARWLEFNLSQFNGPRDLIGAFHQIRDSILQGKLPVAFFDEFDSQSYGWLQYLLAPMQDGRFQEGEATHSVGRSVLVFAGGTSWTFETFGPPLPRHDSAADVAAAYDDFRRKKGPDFKSRLDVSLNVVGPNPRTRAVAISDPQAAHGTIVGPYAMVPVEDDLGWPIRRALMIRGQLRLAPDEELVADDGLLDALLRTPQYAHGSRSLEKILLASRTADRTLRTSFVPHDTQLRMHADAGEFERLLRAPSTPAPAAGTMSDEQVRVLASAIHEHWEMRQSRGSREYTPESLATLIARLETALQKSPADSLLRADLQKAHSNAAAARRIPELLRLIGLHISDTPGSTSVPRLDLQNQLELHLELLAAEEHRGWMQYYLDLGWTCHDDRDDGRFRHNCLKSYSSLKESEKNKDRQSIRNFPDILARAGLHVVRALPESPGGPTSPSTDPV